MFAFYRKTYKYYIFSYLLRNGRNKKLIASPKNLKEINSKN